MEQIRQRKKVLLAISKELKQEEFQQLCFLCQGRLGAGEIESLNGPLDLFTKIELQEENNDFGIRFISNLLCDIKRPSLAKKLKSVSIHLNAKIEDQPAHFISKDCTLRQFHKIHGSDKMHQLFSFIGTIGSGKTELLKQVARQLQEDFVVIPLIEGSSGTKFEDLMESTSYMLKDVCSSIMPFEKCVFETFKSFHIPFILPMDVSRIPHTQKFCSKLKKFFERMRHVPQCKAIITTALFSCKDCSMNSENIIVAHFNEKDSFELLKKFNIHWDLETKQNVINFCRGSPELLVHFARSMNCAKSVARKVSSASLLCFKSNDSFKHQFQGFSKNLKISAVKISVIKEEFSLLLATAVLDNDLETTEEICEMMVKQQLLVKKGGGYFMPKLPQHFIMQIVDSDSSGLSSPFKAAQLSFFHLFIELLFMLNHTFMDFNESDAFISSILRSSNVVHEQLFEAQKKHCCCINYVDKSVCQCPPARQTLLFYNRYKHCFEWALKEGIKSKHLKSWRLAVDCANECVSFLAKAMEKRTIIKTFEGIQSNDLMESDEIRRACTYVSVAFLRMYHDGCTVKGEKNIALLKQAQKLLCNDDIQRNSYNLHYKEVMAHSCSKLGHLIASNRQDEFDAGLMMIKRAIEIRESEVRKRRGSRALIAAGYIDIANAYKHIGRFKEAIEYGKQGFELYKSTLGCHPFTASTMHFVAEMYQKMNEWPTSSNYYMHAKYIGRYFLGNHLDTARFTRGHADFLALRGKKKKALTLYEEAKETGKRYFGREEHLGIIAKCAELCDKEGVARLKEESEWIKRRCSVDWGMQRVIKDGQEEQFGIVQAARKYAYGKMKFTRAKIVLTFLLVVASFLFLHFKYDSVTDYCVCPTTWRKLTELFQTSK